MLFYWNTVYSFIDKIFKGCHFIQFSLINDRMLKVDKISLKSFFNIGSLIILNIQIAFKKIILVWAEDIRTFILNVHHRIVKVTFLKVLKSVWICFLVLGIQATKIETWYTWCVCLNTGRVIFIDFWLAVIWDRVEFATLYLQFATLLIYFTSWLFRLTWINFWKSSAVHTQLGLWTTWWFVLLCLHWIFGDCIIHDL